MNDQLHAQASLQLRKYSQIFPEHSAGLTAHASGRFAKKGPSVASVRIKNKNIRMSSPQSSHYTEGPEEVKFWKEFMDIYKSPSRYSIYVELKKCKNCVIRFALSKIISVRLNLPAVTASISRSSHLCRQHIKIVPYDILKIFFPATSILNSRF